MPKNNKNLKQKAVSGVIWTALQKYSTMLIQFSSGIILARLLTPYDYGCIGMLMIFMLLAESFIDGGFGSALIQKKQPTQREQLQADQKRLKKDIEEKKRRKQVLDQQVKKQMQDVLVLNDEISEKRRTIDTIKTDIDKARKLIKFCRDALTKTEEEINAIISQDNN